MAVEFLSGVPSVPTCRNYQGNSAGHRRGGRIELRPETIEGITFKRTETLHLCGSCIDDHEQSPHVDDDFIIITTGLDGDGYQCHTFGELKSFYDEDKDGQPVSERYHHATNDFDSRAWNEQRLFLYDHFVATAGHYEDTQSRAQLAHMALSATPALKIDTFIGQKLIVKMMFNLGHLGCNIYML